MPGAVYMAVYNRAHELARALSDCSQYREYREAQQRLDATARNMLRDFRLAQARVHAARLSGKEPEASDLAQVERLRGLIELHRPIMDFLALEDRLMTVIGDVQKILAEAVELWDYDLTEGDDEPGV